jgi:hypothetical protein
MAWEVAVTLAAQLESVESRALFVVCTVLVAVPIIAWGPLVRLMPSFANLLVMPSMPAYIEEFLEQGPRNARGERTATFRQGIVFGLAAVLTLINVLALFRVIDMWT